MFNLYTSVIKLPVCICLWRNYLLIVLLLLLRCTLMSREDACKYEERRIKIVNEETDD